MKPTLAGAGFASTCWLPSLMAVIGHDGMTLVALAGAAMLIGVLLALGQATGVITREPRPLRF